MAAGSTHIVWGAATDQGIDQIAEHKNIQTEPAGSKPKKLSRAFWWIWEFHCMSQCKGAKDWPPFCFDRKIERGIGSEQSTFKDVAL